MNEEVEKAVAEELGIQIYAIASAPDEDPVIRIAYRQPTAIWSPVMDEGDRTHWELWTKLKSERIARLAAERERDTLKQAISWALGEDEFAERKEGQGAYWWRTELRNRAKGGTR